MEIPFTAPAFDAFVTWLQDERLGAPGRGSIEIWLPDPLGDKEGIVFKMDEIPDSPAPGLGANLAQVLDGLGIDRALFVVGGVPTPAWAEQIFGEVREALAGAVPRLDLLGVEGYRWESWRLRAESAA